MSGWTRWLRPYRVCALLAVRNDRHYVGRCLQHLAAQGLHVCVIDNDSTDGTAEIVHAYGSGTVIRYVRHPYPGYYDWQGILQCKQQLAAEVAADWYLNVDADEIPEAPLLGMTLREAFRRVARQGYNAVNFNEFVFVPVAAAEPWEGRDYVAGMLDYYFFQPRPLRLVRAWMHTRDPLNVVDSAGHGVAFAGCRVCPTNFVLRHYITLSRNHLVEKYGKRVFAPDELRRGWHADRAGIKPEDLRLPAVEQLHRYQQDGKWDTSRPRSAHFFSPRAGQHPDGPT